MKGKQFTLTSLMLIFALLLTGFASRIAQAQTQPDELEFEGVVTEVDPDDGSFTFVTEDGVQISVGPISEGSFELTVEGEDPLTVNVEEGFTFGTIEVDGEFEIEIEYDEDSGEWMLSKAKFNDDDGDEDNEGDVDFCSEESGEEHPVAVAITERYDTTYEEVIAMFCDGGGDEGSARTGFGQIMLAFHTAQMTADEDTGTDILALRLDGKGWGQIWKELGLIGKPENPGKHKPDGVGPDDVGPPDGVNPPGHSNRPNHAGPKK